MSSSLLLSAKTIPFELEIKSDGTDIKKNLELSDAGEDKTKINFDFALNGKKYNFDLRSVKLADNRSYPQNLDVNIKDKDGNRLGYIFYAFNSVSFLQKMGEFGLYS